MKMDRQRRQQFRDHLYGVFAGVGKALANGRRLVVFDLLCQAERSVEEIAHEAGLPVGSVSQHLQVLRSTGLVESRHEGARVFYRVANESAADLWHALRAFGETELPAVDRVVEGYLSSRDELEAITAGELQERLSNGTVVLIDVRPAREFEEGHIPGSRSLPIDELDSRLGELPDDTEIVAYCRGRYCVFADEAVGKIRQHGLRARRFELGVREWQRLH
jgi:rhodanese-related sulfurtransferase/DNA-binding transcriptional ArsR family regulator